MPAERPTSPAIAAPDHASGDASRLPALAIPEPWHGRRSITRIGTLTEVDESRIDEILARDGRRTEKFLRIATAWFWDVFFRLRSYGQENLPDSGPVLFCPNHSSWWDPFLFARGQRRIVRFMAKASLFYAPVVRWFTPGTGAFPVRRGEGDTFAVEAARRLLVAGHPVAVYPEGTRYRDDDRLGPPKSGAARLALETGVQVIPVACYGAKPRKARGESGPPLRLPRVTTIYGQPMSFLDLEPIPENVPVVRDAIWAEVQRLYDIGRELHRRRFRPRRFIVPPRA